MKRMKIKNVLPNLLTDGDIFSALVTPNRFGDITAQQLGIAYYTHSANKSISNLLENYLDEDNEISDTGRTVIASFLENYFGKRWDAVYNLLQLEYNPLENYDRNELTTTDREAENTTTNTGTVTDSGTHSNSISTQYGATSESNSSSTNYGSYQEDETNSNTKTLNLTDQKTVSAYNSSTYEPEEQDTHTGTDSDSGTKTHSMTAHTDTTSGSNSAQAHTDSTTDSGTLGNTRTDNLKEASESNGTDTVTSRIHGNIGVTTSQQMLLAEWELRRKDFILDIIKDVDSMITLKIY